MNEDAIEAAKRRAGESAAERVDDGMVVGLGTGSTAAHAIEALGQRVDAGLDIEGIPTSFQSRELARETGIPLTTLSDATPDVAIDGADQVADGVLIKGGGGAHAREKVVDTAADRFLVVVDPRKERETLSEPVPVEVLPSARRPVRDTLADLGGTPILRDAARKDGPVVTDNGNLIFDCEFGSIDQPARLADDLASIPGVVAHGLFVGVADEIHVGTEDGVRVENL
jgi:ribose 5-phosphate isomerase A